jgi:hypothetical protein
MREELRSDADFDVADIAGSLWAGNIIRTTDRQAMAVAGG